MDLKGKGLLVSRIMAHKSWIKSLTPKNRNNKFNNNYNNTKRRTFQMPATQKEMVWLFKIINQT